VQTQLRVTRLRTHAHNVHTHTLTHTHNAHDKGTSAARPPHVALKGGAHAAEMPSKGAAARWAAA
jgi:hypothetical protein